MLSNKRYKPNPDFISCNHSIELMLHGLKTFSRSELGTKTWGGIPRLKKRSPLLWCPVIENVCVFPIKEEEVIKDDLHLHRPLFYSELYAPGYVEMHKRLRELKKKTKKR